MTCMHPGLHKSVAEGENWQVTKQRSGIRLPLASSPPPLDIWRKSENAGPLRFMAVQQVFTLVITFFLPRS
ncbi:hypothetical protein FA13DRAFT_325938 [Coprinellus micaceus]|uniref:Uncharacterized protein n=1 Tax=Coprinellus micaceus TaxID=71717 RepID=A0A4Y7SDD2_COPMI|nr:hypothetical protein FA13DRAFT_325938 [Coprinellus micaceus]